MPFVKFKNKAPEKGPNKELFNFDVPLNLERLEFEIQNFNCLGPNVDYQVACNDSDPGFVKVEGKTISID